MLKLEAYLVVFQGEINLWGELGDPAEPWLKLLAELGYVVGHKLDVAARAHEQGVSGVLGSVLEGDSEVERRYHRLASLLERPCVPGQTIRRLNCANSIAPIQSFDRVDWYFISETKMQEFFIYRFKNVILEL